MLDKSDTPSPLGEVKSSTREVLPQILAVCVKNILLLGFGMTLGFPTILIPSLSGNESRERIVLDLETLSWIGSLNLICVPVGCLFSGFITHVVGRKRSMQIVNIPFLIAWVLFHFSSSPLQIFVALGITGLTGGLLEAPVLTYVAEITQPHLRGILSTTSTFAVTFGILCQFLLGTFLFWRTVVLINCIVPIMSFILLIFVPETPVWLISKGRYDDAKKSIAWLRGWVEVASIENEFQELCEHIKLEEEKEHEKKFRNFKLYLKKNFTWPYLIVSLVFFLSHFNGNTTLQVYAIKIFSTLRTPVDKYFATVLIGVVQILGCIFSSVLVNILGKRIINFISLVGAAVCFIVVAFYAQLGNIYYFESSLNINVTNSTIETTSTATLENYQWVPVVFLVMSAFMSYLGIKILPWILTGEVYSTDIRAMASGLSGGIGYIFGFLSNKIFLNLVSSITLPGVFWFYGILGLVGTVLLYFLLPETEGKSLNEITDHFAGRSKLDNKVIRGKQKQVNGLSNKAFEPEVSNGNLESRL